MQLLEDIADELAKMALEVVGLDEETTLVDEMATVIGSSSATLQESFLTAVRIRRAEVRAIEALEKYKAKH